MKSVQRWTLAWHNWYRQLLHSIGSSASNGQLQTSVFHSDGLPSNQVVRWGGGWWMSKLVGIENAILLTHIVPIPAMVYHSTSNINKSVLRLLSSCFRALFACSTINQKAGDLNTDNCRWTDNWTGWELKKEGRPGLVWKEEGILIIALAEEVVGRWFRCRRLRKKAWCILSIMEQQKEDSLKFLGFCGSAGKKHRQATREVGGKCNSEFVTRRKKDRRITLKDKWARFWKEGGEDSRNEILGASLLKHLPAESSWTGYSLEVTRVTNGKIADTSIHKNIILTNRVPMKTVNDLRKGGQRKGTGKVSKNRVCSSPVCFLSEERCSVCRWFDSRRIKIGWLGEKVVILANNSWRCGTIHTCSFLVYEIEEYK